MCRSSWPPCTGESSAADTSVKPCWRPAASASGTPATVSWSVSASSRTPSVAARATTSAGGRAPSEHVECDWRSKVGAGSTWGIAGNPCNNPNGKEVPMSTGTIIAIVIVALIIIALLAFVLPRMRARARVRKRERELQQRREQVAGEHRAEADQRQRQAAQAEQRARIAQREAEAERAQAQLHQERAGLHERGMADDELIQDHERDRFAGTSAMQPANDADGDGHTMDDRAAGRTGADGSALADDRAGGARAADDDYERGRRDEAVERDGNTADPRTTR